MTMLQSHHLSAHLSMHKSSSLLTVQIIFSSVRAIISTHFLVKILIVSVFSLEILYSGDNQLLIKVDSWFYAFFYFILDYAYL